MIYFPDSNVFIHFQPIENWILENGDGPFQIGLCLCTINELDKIKYSSNVSSIKRRVQSLVKKFSSSSPLFFNDIPFIIYMPRAVHEIIDKYLLDKNDKDDLFLASVINYKEDHPLENVQIISNDLGVQLKCKAHDIIFKVPLEGYLLQEDDPLEKENKRLTIELNRLKNLQPKLRLQFKNGETHKEYVINEPLKEYEAEIMETMDNIKQNHPLLEPDLNNEAHNMFPINFYPRTPENVEKYNKALLKYFSSYEVYLRKNKIFDYKRDLTIILNIEIINNGNVPAQNIDLYVYFPDGFRLCEKEDYSENELEPAPPELSEYSLAPVDFSKIMRSMPRFTFPDINISGFSIKKTNSYEVKDHFNSIKHNHICELTPLYLTFDRFEEANSFEISYKITAANVVDIEKGTMNIIIKKNERS
ncbi:MAG: PIN domain-containing protein [Bacteroidales bacterium]|nr:PIN domain-containing protein [Bacteroidales bacterium]